MVSKASLRSAKTRIIQVASATHCTPNGGNLRLVLDVVLSPGKSSSASKARPGLIDVLERLTAAQRPAIVRVDCVFGNELSIAELEERFQPYLFKLRHTVGVKKLLACQFSRNVWSSPGPSEQG
jgi:hypothetical protein